MSRIKMLGLAELVASIDDPSFEGPACEFFMDLRTRVGPHIPVPIDIRYSRDECIARVVMAVQAVTSRVTALRDPMKGSAGHSPGHWVRDYAHALVLAQDPAIPVSYIVPAIAAGALHDVGTLFVERFADDHRAFRHAEVGALIVRAAVLEANVLSEAEADLVAYGIAAHTNYLRPSEMACRDGVVRRILPYPDAIGSAPYLVAQLPRWADRLDCSGPCFAGRHYLTTEEDHPDFDEERGWRIYRYEDSMRPLRRTPEELMAAHDERTLIEYLGLFANSQTNASPYGCFDMGVMVEWRDRYREALLRVLDAVADPTEVNVASMNAAWTDFLSCQVEPSELGQATAARLSTRFLALEPNAQRHWASGFRQAMHEYLGQAELLTAFLDRLPSEYRRLPGIANDIREIIRPSASWVAHLLPA